MNVARRLLRALVFAWRHTLTPGGKALLGASMAAAASGALTLRIPVYHLFFALGCVFALSFVCGVVLMRPRIEVKGSLPPKASAGRPVSTRFTVRNTSRFPVYDLGLGYMNPPHPLEPLNLDRTLPRLGAGETGEIQVGINPPRRGMYSIPPLRAFTTFPFNMLRCDRRVSGRGSLLVLPSFQPIVSIDVPVGRRYQPGGIALSSNIGESPEYIGNRDYRPGDSMRHIDFRSWARLAKPAVREYQEEYYCRVALILDTFVSPGRKKAREGFPDLEAAISLSASVADALSRGEYIIDIFAAGPDLYVFRAGRNIAHFDNILEILACVDECRENPFETIAPALVDELENITSVIYVLLDWDDTRERFVRTAVEAGCKTKVVIVRDGGPSEEFVHAEDWAGQIRALTPADVNAGGIETL